MSKRLIGRISGNDNVCCRRVDVGRGRLIHPVPDADDRKQKRWAGKNLSSNSFASSLLFILMFVVAFAVLTGCTVSPASTTLEDPIKIESIRITAAGNYIDLRYRVVDSERANVSLGPGVKPLLIDEATGLAMQVPMTAKLGSLRQTQADQRPDRTYFVLFANTAGVQPGSRVTAELGDMRFESLTIE